jgi:O-antigen/teichoic acid export membrane protein
MVSGVITTVVNTGILAVGYPIYLHFLGYEQYGLWLVLSVVLTFAQLSNLGIGPAMTKLVAEDYGRGDMEGIQRYVTTALTILCLSGSLVLVVILLFKSSIVGIFKLNQTNTKIISSLVPYVGALNIYVLIVQMPCWLLSGLGRMDLVNYIQTAGRILRVITSAMLLSKGIGLVGLIIGNALSYLVIHVFILVYIRRITSFNPLRLGTLDYTCFKRLLCFGGRIFGGSLVNMLFNPFNRLMLARYAGVASIPIFDIAYTGSMQVKALVEAGLRALMPEVSRLNGMADNKAGQRIIEIYRRAMKLTLYSSFPVYTILAVVAPVLLRVWLRGAFTDELPYVFRIVLIASFINLLAVPSWYTLLGLGFTWPTFLGHLICVCVHLVCVVVFVTLFHTVKPWHVATAFLVGISISSAYVVRRQRSCCRRLLETLQCGLSRTSENCLIEEYGSLHSWCRS